MARKFEDILDECLNRVTAQGDDVEQCLRDYPEFASELEPLLSVAQAVNSGISSLEPRPAFKAAAKQRFMAEVHAKGEKEVNRGWLSIFQLRLGWSTMIAAALVIILVGGGSTVAASTNSMPDDTLYSVKLAVERIRLSLTTGDVQKAKLEAEFANRRIGEISHMAKAENQPKMEESAERLINHIRNMENIAGARLERDNADSQQAKELKLLIERYASEHPVALQAAMENSPDSIKAAVKDVLMASADEYSNGFESQPIKLSATDQVDMPNISRASFSGPIRSITRSVWIVGGRSIVINADTIIEDMPKIGCQATVEFELRGEKHLIASRITINRRNLLQPSTTEVAPKDQSMNVPPSPSLTKRNGTP